MEIKAVPPTIPDFNQIKKTPLAKLCVKLLANAISAVGCVDDMKKFERHVTIGMFSEKGVFHLNIDVALDDSIFNTSLLTSVMSGTIAATYCQLTHEVVLADGFNGSEAINAIVESEYTVEEEHWQLLHKTLKRKTQEMDQQAKIYWFSSFGWDFRKPSISV